MTKKIILFIVVVCQLAFLSPAFGYWYDGDYYESSDNIYNRYGSAAACDGIENTDGRDRCYHSYAVVDENVDLCFKIDYKPGELEWGFCFYDLAIKTKDLSICELISEKKFPGMVAEEIIYENAQCKYNYAQHYQQKDVCYEIEDEEGQDRCLHNFNLKEDDTVVGERTDFFTYFLAVPGIVLFLVLLILGRIFYKESLRTIVIILALVALPLLLLGRYYFNVSEASWIADGDGTIHSLLYLLYVLLCLYGVNVGLAKSVRSFVVSGEGDSFAKDMKKTYLSVPVYMLLISLISTVSIDTIGLRNIVGGLWFIGCTFLFLVGCLNVLYGIRVKMLSISGSRKLIIFLVSLGIFLMIVGAGPFMLVSDFWLHGDITM